MAGNDTHSTLLCHFNGPDGAKEIVDDGITGHIITKVGTANTSTTVKKIGNCSLYLDGNSDSITAPDSADWTLSAPFTVELYFYTNNNAARQSIINKRPSNTNWAWQLQYDGLVATKSLKFSIRTSLVDRLAFQCPWTPTNGQWYHIALIRVNNDNAATGWRIEIDGVPQTLTKTDGAWNYAIPSVASSLYIGTQGDAGNYLNGYVDEVRISNIDRYSAIEPFTPPATAFTSDANTLLLLHFESHDTAIGGSYLPATFYGTAQLDTAVKTFGTASLLLDGDSDYVTFPDNALWNFGANNFTIDLRVRWAALPGASTSDTLVGQFGAAGLRAWMFYVYNNAGIYELTFDYTTNGTTQILPLVTSSGLLVNTWYHLSCVRSSSSILFSQDGIMQTAVLTIGTNAIFTGSTTALSIGANNAANLLNGYIDELRISNSVRWTANFTPPSAEYSEDAPAPSTGRRIFMVT